MSQQNKFKIIQADIITRGGRQQLFMADLFVLHDALYMCKQN